MAILIVGSIALDTIETPLGKVIEVLGGAAVYSAVSASFFAPVKIIGVVGEDFPEEYLKLLSEKNIDLKGLVKLPGKTFRWEGKYLEDMNQRQTIRTELNVFEQFKPTLHEEHRSLSYVFLANIHPQLQLEVLEQVENPELVVCDTMNLWINTARRELEEVLARVDILLINDEEARLLTKEYQLARAGRKLLERGLKAVVIKRGEHGATIHTKEGIFFAPAYPLEVVKDPTGAGDSFAGGFIGYLWQVGKADFSELKRAGIYGSVVASFTVEEFGLKRLLEISKKDIEQRFEEFKELVAF